ncbi:MAG: tetratricopeptide repeat protein [Terriglobales bacterium]
MIKSRLLITAGTFILLVAVLAGCSSQSKFARAERMEQSGNYGGALAIYQKLVDQIPARNPRTRSQVYFRMGECLYRLDRIAEAFTAFEKAADIEPGNMAAQLRLGEFFLAAGATDRAREQAELVLKKTAGNTEATALWAGALAAAGKTDAAKDAYRRVLSADPKRISAAIALADIYNQENNVQEARKVLHESAAANPKSALPWLALGRLNEQEGEVAAAEQNYRQAVAAEDAPESNLRLAQFLQRTARINEAEQVLRRVDTQRPAQPTALPDFELIAGRPGTAMARYQAALASVSTQPPPKRKAVPGLAQEQLRNRALLATRLVEADIDVAGQKSGVEKTEALQRARAHLAQYRLDLDPATLAILQAELALAGSDLPMAALQAKTAVSLAPQSAAAHYVLAMSRQRSGNSAEARAEWLAALESDSHFVPARLALTEQALASGDTKGAEQYVMAVVRDEPGNVRALNLFARVLLAEKRYTAAATIAQRAMAVGQTAPQPHLILGQIALQQRRFSDALIHFEQAVLLEPHSADAIEGLTRVYRTGAVTRPMLAKMEKIAANNPPSAALMEIAGRLYADHGWFEDARRCLQAALRLDPQRSTAATALAKTYAATGQLGAAVESASRGDGHSAALLAGVRAQDRKDTAAAIENYERAIREGDHSGIAANNLAWLYVEQGANLERALELAESARSLAPENPAILDTVGLVRLRLRKYTEAIQVLESARNLASEHPSDSELLGQIRRHLSEAYLRAGKTDAAQYVSNSVAQ